MMPKMNVRVGRRSYEVNCAAGEERLVQKAAKILDSEVQILNSQTTNITESDLLLAAGLVLADKITNFQSQIEEVSEQVLEVGDDVEKPSFAISSEPIQGGFEDSKALIEVLTELAMRTEALASAMESKMN